MIFIYNLLLPLAFLFFIPGLLLKYRNRGGWKSTFGERFGRFTPERVKELSEYHGAIWIHSVSVGETMIALGFVKQYLKRCPEQKFVISTTTTTGQELARSRCPENTAVIFCPIDFIWMVRRAYNVVKPSKLIIFETELWPNLLCEAVRRKVPVTLVNGRMSDHSAKGYRRARMFFAPLLRKFSLIAVQTNADRERYLAVCPDANVIVSGNMKFDQTPPENIADPGLPGYFGEGDFTVILGASTHPGEEELIAREYQTLLKEYPQTRLVLVPRHAERGADVENDIRKLGLSCIRRSQAQKTSTPVEVLIADTTGEMFKFINSADVVIMGKSLAGHDEGHNLIEPALLDKAIVTGSVLRNFRFILNVLVEAGAVITVSGNQELYQVLQKLIADPQYCRSIGKRAGDAIRCHCGAMDRCIDLIEKL
ncbi:MAG: 3-deoxy-D-manno-octulosonic acid transferase [Lentisphaeria bacterium]|nr:3-deoxy-D-manno-octulosonic acid transferase [Lentisphaeria bacterium]MBO5899661.1 3-deoxy-D-manno-octulosonic acid transferase [Lentisphaeria bacterium]